MKRTYVDITGGYYDNLDKIIDWGEEADIRTYNYKNMVIKTRDPNWLKP